MASFEIPEDMNDAGRRPRVLITDAEARWAVAACRALADAGYRVAAASAVRPAATQWSTACAERVTLPSPFADPRAFVVELERLVSEGRYDAIVPASEASLQTLSEHRERFERAIPLGLPPHRDVMRCLDKTVMATEAGGTGLAPPPSRVCTSVGEAERVPCELGFPVMVKPARTLVEAPGARRRGQASLLASNESELVDAIRHMGIPFVVQGYDADSAILSYAGVSLPSGIAAVTASRYIRTWPPLAGSASLAVTVDPPDALSARVDSFIARMRWIGIFEIELLERHDGSFSMIDFNPRLYGSISLAIASGANLPAIWCAWLLRGEEISARSSAGWAYRWEAGETKNALDRVRRMRVAEALDIARPRRRVVHPLFRLTDPGPLAASFVQGRARRRRTNRSV